MRVADAGRSLQTQERLPVAVLSRNFDYGFKLGLMLKVSPAVGWARVRACLCA